MVFKDVYLFLADVPLMESEPTRVYVLLAVFPLISFLMDADFMCLSSVAIAFGSLFSFEEALAPLFDVYRFYLKPSLLYASGVPNADSLTSKTSLILPIFSLRISFSFLSCRTSDVLASNCYFISACSYASCLFLAALC
jgi:hypothetical protein